MANAKDTLLTEQEFMENFEGNEEKITQLIEGGILVPFIGGTENKKWFSTEMKNVATVLIEKEIPFEALENIISVDPVSQNPSISREGLRNYLRGKVHQVKTETPKFGVEELDASEISDNILANVDVGEIDVPEDNAENNNVTTTTETMLFTSGNIIHYLIETPIEELLHLSELEDEIINDQMRNLTIDGTTYGKYSLEQLRRSPIFEEIKPNNFRRLSRKETFIYLLIRKDIIPNVNMRLELLQDKANINNVLMNHNELGENVITELVNKYNGNVITTGNTTVEETSENVENTETSEETLSVAEILTKLTALPENVLKEVWANLPEEFKE